MNLKQFLSSARRQKELSHEYGARLRTTPIGFTIADFSGCDDPAQAWLRDCAARAEAIDDDYAPVRRAQWRAGLEKLAEKPFRDERSGSAEPERSEPEPPTDPVPPPKPKPRRLIR